MKLINFYSGSWIQCQILRKIEPSAEKVPVPVPYNSGGVLLLGYFTIILKRLIITGIVSNAMFKTKTSDPRRSVRNMIPYQWLTTRKLFDLKLFLLQLCSSCMTCWRRRAASSLSCLRLVCSLNSCSIWWDSRAEKQNNKVIVLTSVAEPVRFWPASAPGIFFLPAPTPAYIKK